MARARAAAAAELVAAMRPYHCSAYAEKNILGCLPPSSTLVTKSALEAAVTINGLVSASVTPNNISPRLSEHRNHPAYRSDINALDDRLDSDRRAGPISEFAIRAAPIARCAARAH